MPRLFLTIEKKLGILLDDKPFLFVDASLFAWSPSGYGKSEPLPKKEKLTILTPRSIVNTFRAGYMPQMKL